MFSLPVEILHYILRLHLSHHNPFSPPLGRNPTLLELSLVSSTFASFTQELAWSRIVIKTPKEASDWLENPLRAKYKTINLRIERKFDAVASGKDDLSTGLLERLLWSGKDVRVLKLRGVGLLSLPKVGSQYSKDDSEDDSEDEPSEAATLFEMIQGMERESGSCFQGGIKLTG